MSLVHAQERRTLPRFSSDRLMVTLRARGRLSRLAGMAVDFNRYGMAVLIDQPLPCDKQVYASLRSVTREVHQVVGVVHNCTAQSDGYRCGIQFRIESALQMDSAAVKAALLEIEQQFRVVVTQ